MTILYFFKLYPTSVQICAYYSRLEREPRRLSDNSDPIYRIIY